MYENFTMFLLKLPDTCKKFVTSDCIEFHLPRKHHDCPFCGSTYTYVHDYRKQNLCGFSTETAYIYKRRRYRCQDCGKTFSESNSFIERYQHTPCSEIEHIVQELADYAGVPVFNGLTDEFHPTQMLADVLTMIEHCDKPLSEISYVYIGDARNNMGNSLLLIGAKLGMDVRICGPKALLPEASLVEMCEKFAKESGARITVTEDIDKAVKGVDFVHTDVWVSMGEPLETWGERIKLLLPYQVTPELMKRTGNPKVKFMHCLPAFHNSETKVGRQIAEKYAELANGIEVTEDVFESSMNIAFEQAENRMHTIKAVMVASLA